MIKRRIKQIGLVIISTLFILAGCSSSDIATIPSKEDAGNVKASITDASDTEQSKSEIEEEFAQNNEDIKYSNSEIHFINTGNSDSILIKHGEKGILIDGGDNDDEQLVVNYLREQGIKTIEYMIATHPDADHIGGLDSVINNFTVNNLLVSNGDADTQTYSDFINAAANKGVSPSVPLQGAKFTVDSATLEVLSCANVTDKNNRSIVLLYTNGNDKLLFMGDAELEIINTLSVGDVDLIKVSHHGSSNGTTKAFMQGITPEYVVITVGANNKYGHPHIETMDTLKGLNIPVYRTDEGGDIVFTSTGNGITTNNQPNSYNAGAKKETTTTSSSSNDTSSSNNNTTPVTPTVPETPQTNTEVSGRTVYANGGSSTSNKYHKSPTAHNMEGAIEMSESDAQNQGYVACKTCFK